MKRMGGASLAMAALCLALSAGAAHADDFVAGASGNWTLPDTWLVGGSVPPDYPAAGDTATITGGFTVTANAAIDPLITSVSIATDGTLRLITLAPTAPWLMDGGTIQFDVDDSRLAGDMTVNSASTINVQNIWPYNGCRINGTIADGTTTTGTLTKSGGGILKLTADNSGFTGGWDVQDGMLFGYGTEYGLDGALGTGTITLNNGADLTTFSYSAAKGPSGIVVNSTGSIILVREQSTVRDLEIVLNADTSIQGGYVQGGNTYLNGNTLTYGTIWNGGNTYNSALHGDGLLTMLRVSIDAGSTLRLGGDNSDFSGDINIPVGMTLQPQHANALGTGSVFVYGTLSLNGLPGDMGGNPVVDGGAIATTLSKTIGASALVTLIGDSKLYVGGAGSNTMTVDGKLTGSGALVATGGGNVGDGSNGTELLILNNAANDYTGGTKVQFEHFTSGSWYRGSVRATADGVLSTGTVDVLNSRLITEPAAGSGTAVFTSVSQVNVAGGTLELKSTENAGKIHLYAGGALDETAGTTTMTYGAGGNIHVHDGAILPEDWVSVMGHTLPTAGEIEGGGRIYAGLRGDGTTRPTITGAYIVDAVTKGVATLDNWPILSGTVTDTLGTGISLYAQDNRWMTLSGAKLVTAGPVNLEGGGDYGLFYGNGNVLTSNSWTGFKISSVDNFDSMTGAKVVNMNARGVLNAAVTGAIPGGVTVNMNNGLLACTVADAIAGTVQLNEGSVLYLKADLAGGSINANSGSAVWLNNNSRVASVSTWNGGAKGVNVVLGASGITTLPTDGSINYLIASRDYDGHGTMYVGDNTRVTVTPDAYLIGYTEYNFLRTGATAIEVAAGSSSGRVAMEDIPYPGKAPTALLMPQLNFAGKTLIVGDPNPFMSTLWVGGESWRYVLGDPSVPLLPKPYNQMLPQFVSMDQTGCVRLVSTASTIGKIDVQAGMLQTWDAPAQTVIGGATEIHLAAGATLAMAGYTTSVLNTVVSGNGTVNPLGGGGVGDRTVTLTPTADREAGISPGDSAGILHVQGSLSFGALPPPAGVTVALQNAESNYNQDGHPAGNMIDGSLDTGWAIGGGEGSDQPVAVEVAGGSPAGGAMTFKLEQNYSPYLVGKFRLSYTTDAQDGTPLDSSWTELTPTSFSSLGSTMVADGNAIVAYGTYQSEVYSVNATIPAGVTGFRMETLNDPNGVGTYGWPTDGPGRTDTGNFWVKEFTVQEFAGDPTYAKYYADVVGDGGVAGIDHDQVLVTGTANVANAEVVVSLPLPGFGLEPSTPNWGTPDPDDVVIGEVGDMVIVSAGSVTGQFVSFAIAPTAGVDLNPAIPGVQEDYHWILASGASPLDYSSATEVVLKGADILWMGLPGDANLDDSCDVSDLSLLAGSYRKSGTWLQGDFNFDGNVDVSDLSLLAGNFRTSNPYFTPGSGGAPVPEPMTMVLLGLGGLAVLARRRNR